MRFYPADSLPRDLFMSDVRPHSLTNSVPDGGYVKVQDDDTHSLFDSYGNEISRVDPEYSEQHVEEWLNALHKQQLGQRDDSYGFIPAFPNGWHAGAAWAVGTYDTTGVKTPIIGQYDCNLRVPGAPVGRHGQLVCLWPGLMAGNFGGFPLLQPVLHWGNWQAGDPTTGWFIRSWYLNKAKKVFLGQRVTGIGTYTALSTTMQCTAHNASTKQQNWVCRFNSYNASLTVLSMPPPLFRCANVVHESKLVVALNDYWTGGPVQFANLTVKTGVPGAFITPKLNNTTYLKWSPFKLGGNAGSVLIKYNKNPGALVYIYPPT